MGEWWGCPQGQEPKEEGTEPPAATEMGRQEGDLTLVWEHHAQGQTPSPGNSQH